MGELLEPFKLLARVWAMRYGPYLVVPAVGIVALVVVVKILLDVVWPDSLWVVLFSIGGGLWVLIIILGVASIAGATKLRKEVAGLIERGEWIKARLSHTEDKSLSRYEEWLDAWDKGIAYTLKGSEYDLRWRDNAGLPEQAKTNVGNIDEKALKTYQAYVDSRLRRLDYIFNDLRQV